MKEERRTMFLQEERTVLGAGRESRPNDRLDHSNCCSPAARGTQPGDQDFEEPIKRKNASICCGLSRMS